MGFKTLNQKGTRVNPSSQKKRGEKMIESSFDENNGTKRPSARTLNIKMGTRRTLRERGGRKGSQKARGQWQTQSHGLFGRVGTLGHAKYWGDLRKGAIGNGFFGVKHRVIPR